MVFKKTLIFKFALIVFVGFLLAGEAMACGQCQECLDAVQAELDACLATEGA